MNDSLALAESLERLAIPSLDQLSLSAELSALQVSDTVEPAGPEPDSPPPSPEPTGDDLLGGASSDQSASEDSSVTDSERTLIGGAPTPGRSSMAATPSNSPAGSDYQSMLSPQEEVRAENRTSRKYSCSLKGWRRYGTLVTFGAVEFLQS